MHATPLTFALTLCLTFLIPSVFAMPHQQRGHLPLSDLPPAVWQMCVGGANATIVHSSAPVQGAKGLVLTTGSCINNDTDTTQSTVPIPVPSQASEVDTRSLEARDWCPTVPNTCLSSFSSAFPSDWINQNWVPKCGASCSSTCYAIGTGVPGPDPNDCQMIFNAMIARPDQIFALEPNNFLLFTVRTCGTGIQNQIAANPANWACSQKMIYDYSDWAAVGSFLAFNCQATQGARGGNCVADTGIYTNVPDFFIQVYGNQ